MKNEEVCQFGSGLRLDRTWPKCERLCHKPVDHRKEARALQVQHLRRNRKPKPLGDECVTACCSNCSASAACHAASSVSIRSSFGSSCFSHGSSTLQIAAHLSLLLRVRIVRFKAARSDGTMPSGDAVRPASASKESQPFELRSLAKNASVRGPASISQQAAVKPLDP